MIILNADGRVYRIQRPHIVQRLYHWLLGKRCYLNVHLTQR